MFLAPARAQTLKNLVQAVGEVGSSGQLIGYQWHKVHNTKEVAWEGVVGFLRILSSSPHKEVVVEDIIKDGAVVLSPVAEWRLNSKE